MFTLFVYLLFSVVPTNIPVGVLKSCFDTEANNSDRSLRVRYFLARTRGRLVAALQSVVSAKFRYADPGKLGRAAFVSVMEPADFRKLHHFSKFRGLYRTRNWRVFLQGKVSTCALVVFKV